MTPREHFRRFRIRLRWWALLAATAWNYALLKLRGKLRV